MNNVLIKRVFLFLVFFVVVVLFLSDGLSMMLANGGSEIFWKVRFPRFVGALGVGILLSLSGLLMQSFFRNPLASPSLLGVNASATLSVAFWFILGSIPWIANIPLTIAAFAGSVIYSICLIFLSNLFKDKLILLLFGLLFTQLASSLTTMTSSLLSAQKLKFFYFWGLGSLGRVSLDESIVLATVAILMMALILMVGKKIDLLWLGEEYAKAHGLSIRLFKVFVVLVTAISSALVTSFVGPIAFVGIIAPNLAKYFLKRSDHRSLALYSALLGVIVVLFSEYCVLKSSNMFPLNSILGLLALPVMVYFFYVQWRERRC